MLIVHFIPSIHTTHWEGPSCYKPFNHIQLHGFELFQIQLLSQHDLSDIFSESPFVAVDSFSYLFPFLWTPCYHEVSGQRGDETFLNTPIYNEMLHLCAGDGGEDEEVHRRNSSSCHHNGCQGTKNSSWVERRF